ncbi:Os11g0144950 [Oryza sativa Japonica Group]|uniref:Os11g0144950 protein n=1 Tax=Oryza sativa subsp. japonica TaxID=39947 RepID=A0A0P0XZP7_ORYSJ|nr:hypothetical protein EE612_053444 [Oryza sativa]BAT12649.1 Os11g0144950 [Oryza sativa Japonica Group]
MAGLALLPEPARWVHACFVGEACCKNRDEEQELSPLLQLPLLLFLLDMLLQLKQILEPFRHTNTGRTRTETYTDLDACLQLPAA